MPTPAQCVVVERTITLSNLDVDLFHLRNMAAMSVSHQNRKSALLTIVFKFQEGVEDIE